MTRKEILNQTAAIVCGDRDQQYGSPEDSFSAIAAYWTTYLRQTGTLPEGMEVSPHQVGMMMALLKVARIGGGQIKADSYIDLAGYAACAGEIALVKQPGQPEPLNPHPLIPGTNDLDWDQLYAWASRNGYERSDEEILAAVGAARSLDNSQTLGISILDWARDHGFYKAPSAAMAAIRDARSLPCANLPLTPLVPETAVTASGPHTDALRNAPRLR